MVPPEISRPDVLKGVDDLIRVSLEAFRNACFAWLLISTGVVVAGLLFELPEIYLESINATRQLLHPDRAERHIPPWVKLVVSFGWFLIVLGVAGEFVADGFVSRADGFVQKFDEVLLAETKRNAGDARISAKAAADAATLARDQSGKAVSSATNALNLANGARQEADSFEKDIKSAKTKADAAESHLNEALQRAADVTAELKRLTTPRRLPHTAQVVSPLKIFRGAEYLFIGTRGDTECFDLVKDIDAVLRSAEWKRVKSIPLKIGICGVVPKRGAMSHTIHLKVLCFRRLHGRRDSSSPWMKSSGSSQRPVGH
jgi:hypothetical protein